YAGAVEDVVRDLERDAKRQPEGAGAAGQPACGLEELARLQRAPLQVGPHRRIGIEALRTLQGLAARETERRVREDRDRTRVAGRRELRKRAREEIVAGGARCLRAVSRPRRGMAAPKAGA